MRKHRELLWGAGLALFVLAAAAALVRYLGVHDDPARDVIEERAVQAIQRLGGKVIRDEKAPGKPVIAVFLRTPAMTDAGLKELAELKQLRELDLTGSRVTAQGLKELAGLQQLQTLHVGEPQWFSPRWDTNPDSMPLVRLRQLKTLYLKFDPEAEAAKIKLYGTKGMGSEALARYWFEKHLPGCRVIFR
jgi:hypothetical protein